MQAVDSVTLVKNFEKYCDELCSLEDISVVGRAEGHKPMVLMPLEEYNKMLKKQFELKHVQPDEDE